METWKVSNPTFDETKQIFSIEKREETHEETITRTYGQLAFQSSKVPVAVGLYELNPLRTPPRC
jgi:hypothetical protein